MSPPRRVRHEQDSVRDAGGIIGVDISAESLPLAMGRGCYENAVVGDLDEPLALDTGSFDAIISVGVFSYVEKFDTCFDEMVRLARPGASIPLLSSNELVGGGLPWMQDGYRPIGERGQVEVCT